MARPGPPPKSAFLRGIEGGRSAGAVVSVLDLPPLEEVPPPPAWLPNHYAVAEWQRLAPLLQAAKLLTEPALGALGHLCAIQGKVLQLYAAGETPHASMLAQLRGFLNDFGLTPASQGKVKAGQNDDKESNKFAKHRRRPDATG